jgi:hypothetical protein
MTNSRSKNRDPKPGTSGVLTTVDGYRVRYDDIPMSGELLKDDPNCPDWVEVGKRYWVRHSIGGMQIVGPILTVVDKRE